ncbi:MAG: DotI/IcmL family type IV secretion protein, partial [Deltaproteobacteria bacterium]|nr:DotI/IcmL family type IV secretion protein [Deltaproteobacteria bacterium]
NKILEGQLRASQDLKVQDPEAPDLALQGQEIQGPEAQNFEPLGQKEGGGQGEREQMEKIEAKSFVKRVLERPETSQGLKPGLSFEAVKLNSVDEMGQTSQASSGDEDFEDFESWDFDPSQCDLSEIDHDGEVLEGEREMSPSHRMKASGAEVRQTPRANQVEPKASEKDLYQPHGAEVVIESRDWYLGQNRRLFKILLFICPIILLSLALNAWQVVFKPEPRYFAVTQDLRIMDMPPLSEPVIESRALGNWTGDVVVRALSLNFLTWRQSLSDLRGEFDPKGFESFLESLKNGGHLDKIEKERLSLSTLISGAPVITGSGLRGGVMTWKLEMPLVLSYESSAGVVASQKLLAEVVVQRTKPSLNPKGVVIRQIVLTKTG